MISRCKWRKSKKALNLCQRGEFRRFVFVFVGGAEGWWYPWMEASGQHQYSNNAQHKTSVVKLWFLIVPLGPNSGHLRGHIWVHSHGSGLTSRLWSWCFSLALSTSSVDCNAAACQNTEGPLSPLRGCRDPRVHQSAVPALLPSVLSGKP